MYAIGRHLLALTIVLCTLGLASDAKAWLETSIKSDNVTVDLDREGKALVTHELTIKVRGGPLEHFDIAGVDSDAEGLPDATVVRATSGRQGLKPVPLKLEKLEDDTLRLTIDREKGLRRGTYLFRFSYRSNLLERDLIRAEGRLVDIRWVGPRFDDGIASARVVFRLPATDVAPHLPETDLERQALGLTEEYDGVFLSTLRRGADKDELEVVRPHVAKGEPVVWRVRAHGRAFDDFTPPEPPDMVVAPVNEDLLGPKQRSMGLVVLGAVALLYALLVVLKHMAVRRACSARGAQPRALVPLPISLRAPLAGVLLAAAVVVALLAREPTGAAALVVAAIALAVHLSPRAEPALRGPGRWLPLSDDEAFDARATPKLPGRWLDTGALPGFLVFATLLMGALVAAAAMLPHSAYHALMVLLASAAFLPIFCTGRAAELPPDPVGGPRGLLGWLARKLRRDDSNKVVAWARIPDSSAEPDELRLLIVPRERVPGLTAIEVAMEYQQGAGGTLALPCVLVRVQDDSLAYRALPRSVVWTRGRNPDERVTVIRPKLPTRALTLKLVTRLLELLAAARAQSPASSQRRQRSGRSASTSKPSSVPSPAHAM